MVELGEVEESLARALRRRSEALAEFHQFSNRNVGRAMVGSADGSTRSVVVKWAGYSMDAQQARQRRRVEAAALSFLGDIDQTLCPRLEAAADGLLLLEDLSEGDLLWDLLREGDTVEAVEAYRRFARVLAQLHVSTIGAQPRWHAARETAGLRNVAAGHEPIDAVPWDWKLPDLHQLGVTATPPAQRDLDRVRLTLISPGPFLAFSNGDPGANNFVALPHGGRLIDFEHASPSSMSGQRATRAGSS